MNNISYGTIYEVSVDLLLRQCWDNLSEDETLQFQREALYLMPIWEMTRNITLKYLKIYPGPYAIIKPNYDSCSRSNKNHCISELSYPVLWALCIGSIVMLLKII